MNENKESLNICQLREYSKNIKEMTKWEKLLEMDVARNKVFPDEARIV